MPGKFRLSKMIFDNLVKHLVDVEDEKGRLREFFSDRAERQELEKLLKNYIAKIDAFLKSTQTTENCGDTLPFIVIGSKVELINLDNKQEVKLRLISPFKESVSDGVTQASCLSPVGRVLLLKQVGDKVKVKAPRGTFHYEILGVSYP